MRNITNGEKKKTELIKINKNEIVDMYVVLDEMALLYENDANDVQVKLDDTQGKLDNETKLRQDAETKLNEVTDEKKQAMDSLLQTKALLAEKENEADVFVKQVLALKKDRNPSSDAGQVLLMLTPTLNEAIVNAMSMEETVDCAKESLDKICSDKQYLEKYKIVILMPGWQDIIDGLDSMKAYSKVKGMIKQVRSAGPEVAIVQLPPAKETLKACEIALMNQQLSTTGNSIEGVQYIWIPEYSTLPRHKLIDMDGSILPEACALIGKTISKDLVVPTNPKAIPMPSQNPGQPQKPGLRENRSFGNTGIQQHRTQSYYLTSQQLV